jgi:hypothetical protein
MDVDTIQPGEDFVTVIQNAVSSCEILIAIIGRDWLSAGSGDRRRLDNPNDFVRMEIAHALDRGIRVIPVLVQGAIMPTQRDLPDDLAPLARRNAIELTDSRWQSNVDQLISLMEPVPTDQLKPGPDTLPQSEEGSRLKNIYLIYEKQDYHAIAPLEDHLFGLGFEVTSPLMEGDDAEVREDHKDSLLLCDAVLIFYGNASEGWLRTKLRDLQKIAGYGRTQPMLAQAVYIGPPRTPSKDRFPTLEGSFIIRNFGEFAPNDLSDFVRAVQASETDSDVRSARDQQPQSSAKQLSKIFISYRRDNTVGHASRLYYKLVEHFGKDLVFMDVDFKPGEDVIKEIENAVSSCEILLAIIGPAWLYPAFGEGGPQNDQDDFAHKEIAHALGRGIRVIPVLVQKASMPNPEMLPDDLAKLARLNAMELSDDGWQRDVDQLIISIERLLAKQEGTAQRRYGVEPELPIEVAEEERHLHIDARRYARMLASEIKLYNEQKVEEGRRANDLYERLREIIDRSREMYDKRVAPSVAARYDYFHEELVNMLADGDAGKLGSGYSGPSVAPTQYGRPFGVTEPKLPKEASEEERRLHNDARRFARLLVSEIKLNNEPKVKEGRRENDLYGRLREEIENARQMYDKRVAPAVTARHDYFHQELVNTLAEGDIRKLGSGYSRASVDDDRIAAN